MIEPAQIDGDGKEDGALNFEFEIVLNDGALLAWNPSYISINVVGALYFDPSQFECFLYSISHMASLYLVSRAS